MNRKFAVLYVVLVALAGVLIWQLRVRWVQARAKERETISRRVAPKRTLAPGVASAPAAPSPAEYVDVAQRTLFSKDRNPNVVVEAAKAEPEPPMPALPRYHGQMAIGDPVAILSVGTTGQKGYRVGDAVGDFKLLAFDREKIKLEWHEKTVEKKLAELVPKEEPPPAAQNAAPPPPKPGAAKNNAQAMQTAGPVTTVMSTSADAGSTASLNGSNSSSTLGPDIGGGMRACVAGDDTASGTVVSGFRKNVIKSMFGEICRWEPAK
jgi:hypothetical protein